MIAKAYKQNRHEDDRNQALSVQPWGSDSDKRRYFLMEGLGDTAFRVYRESNPAGFNRTWWSVAGSIEELTALAAKLEEKDGGPKARKLAQNMLAAVPRFEATEEVCWVFSLQARCLSSADITPRNACGASIDRRRRIDSSDPRQVSRSTRDALAASV